MSDHLIEAAFRPVTPNKYRPLFWRVAVTLFALALAPYSCGFLYLFTDHPPFPTLTLPIVTLGAGLLIFLADRATSHRILSRQIRHPTLQTALRRHGGLLAMVLVFWPVMGLFTVSSCVPFCGFPILFSVVFAYVGLGSASTLYASLAQAWKTDLQWRPVAALMVGVVSWAFTLWSGVFGSWEEWHLHRYWDDYNAVVEMDRRAFERDVYVPGEYTPLRLPEEYTHLAPDGFYKSYDSCDFGPCNVAYFATYYGGPTNSHGLVWCLDDDRCWLGGFAAYMTADSACIPLHPHWWRCIVW